MYSRVSVCCLYFALSFADGHRETGRASKQEDDAVDVRKKCMFSCHQDFPVTLNHFKNQACFSSCLLRCSNSKNVNLLTHMEYITSAFPTSILHWTFATGLPGFRFFHVASFLVLLSIQQRRAEWAVLTSPGGVWASWRLRDWGGGGASVAQLSIAGCLSLIMVYWPPLVCGHEVTIHHSHVHVSLDSPLPLPKDHTGRLGNMTTTADWHLIFSFLSSLLLSLFPLHFPVHVPEPILFPCCIPFQQPYTTWTLDALSSNPPPVLSELRNNSHRACTAQNRSMQTNSSTPTWAVGPSASNSISQAACHCFTLSPPHCVSGKDSSFCTFDRHPNGICFIAVQRTTTANG